MGAFRRKVLWGDFANAPFFAGVMRFLQTEWHRHERDRNAWQIERAEMKSRIGKLEGDGRTNKRLRESLDKHVRILEHALKKEREKAKAPTAEGQTEEKKGEDQDAKKAAKPESKRGLIRACPCSQLTFTCSSTAETSQFLP
jgi:hypothetical protein